MLTASFRRRLVSNEATSWAADLDEPQLETLLWMLGEFGCRADLILEFLAAHESEFSVRDESFSRLRLAARWMPAFVAGARFGVEEVTRAFEDAIGNGLKRPIDRSTIVKRQGDRLANIRHSIQPDLHAGITKCRAQINNRRLSGQVRP